MHSELRKKLGLETNTEVMLATIGSIVTLQKLNKRDITRRYIIIPIDNFGIIVLPAEIRKNMGWAAGDEIDVYCVDDEMVIFHRDKSKQ